MSKNNDGNISIANILALVGLAAIGAVTFFGSLLHSSDGKPGGSIMWAVAVVVLLGFLLFMSIKAKGAEDNYDKWRYVEWASLVLYVVVVILCSSSFNRFFYIVSEKEEMQAQARLEIKAIQQMYTSYEHQQKTALNDAAEQIQNYLDSHRYTNDKRLSEYVSGIGTNVESWSEKAKAIVKAPEDSKLKDIASRVESWNMFDLSSLAFDLSERDSKAWSELEAKIIKYGDENKLIPVIKGGGTTPYYLDGYAKFDLGTPVTPEFSKMLSKADGIAPMGIVLYIILNLLVLLNYLVAPRASFVGPRVGKGGSKSGGLDL